MTFEGGPVIAELTAVLHAKYMINSKIRGTDRALRFMILAGLHKTQDLVMGKPCTHEH